MTTFPSRRDLFSLAAVAGLTVGAALLAGCGLQMQAQATVAAGTPAAAPEALPPTLKAAPSPTAPPATVGTATPGRPPIAAVATTPLAVATIAGPFATPAPTVWASLMPVVREYCSFLKQAIVAGNVAVLWQRYPALQHGASATTGKGKNVEGYYVDQYRPLHPFDGDMSPEAYAPIKVKLAGDRADVMVHGWQSYLRWSYDNAGKPFVGKSGFEFVVQLFLQR